MFRTLIKASEGDDAKTVRILLDAKANVNESDQNGYTALLRRPLTVIRRLYAPYWHQRLRLIMRSKMAITHSFFLS